MDLVWASLFPGTQDGTAGMVGILLITMDTTCIIHMEDSVTMDLIIMGLVVDTMPRVGILVGTIGMVHTGAITLGILMVTAPIMDMAMVAIPLMDMVT